MATGSFGSAGLGQLGQDKSYATGGGPLSDAFSGAKDILLTKGIKASGLQDYLNGLGGNTAVPPPTSTPVAPMVPAAQMAPPVAPVMNMGASDMGAGAMESILHPELASTLLTSLF
jgi:hypothetical protein